MYDVITIADVILRIAKQHNISLTPLQLMKLTYIAHGWSLAINDRPLFNNRIEAWRYGPVMPDLYDATRKYGGNKIPLDLIGNGLPEINEKDLRLIQEVYLKYGQLSGIQLSALTHKTNTPWYESFEMYKNNLIDDGTIKKHYLDILERREDV